TANLICGIDWVTATRSDAERSNDIAVVNMSIGGKGADDGNCGLTNKDALHLAFCKSVAAGVTYAVAAGNESDDLAAHVPAAYNEVLAVTAMADYDGIPGGRDPNLCYGDPAFADDKFAFFSN